MLVHTYQACLTLHYQLRLHQIPVNKPDFLHRFASYSSTPNEFIAVIIKSVHKVWKGETLLPLNTLKVNSFFKIFFYVPSAYYL